MANRSLRLLTTLLMLPMVLVGCGGFVSPDASESSQLHARVWGIVQVASHEPGIVPDEGSDLQPGDRCPCNDTSKPGRSGDGLSICTMCNGTLVIVGDDEQKQFFSERAEPALKPLSVDEFELIQKALRHQRTAKSEKKALANRTDKELAMYEINREEIHAELRRRAKEGGLFWSQKNHDEALMDIVNTTVAKKVLTIRYGSNCQPCREAKAAIKADGPLKDYIEEYFIIERVPAKPGQNVPAFFIGTADREGFKNADGLLAWLKRVK